MLPGLTSVTLKSYRLAAACAAPTRWKDIWPPCPHDRGSASVDTTAPANASPSTPMPSSVSTTKRSSGPLPYTFDVPSTTETVPAPFCTKLAPPTAAGVPAGSASPSNEAVGDDAADGGATAVVIAAAVAPGTTPASLDCAGEKTRSPRVRTVAIVSSGI